MVSSRRSRILVLTAISFVVGLLIFTYPRQSPLDLETQSGTEPDLNIQNDHINHVVEDSSSNEIKVNGHPNANGKGDSTDLSTAEGDAFDPEKEYKLILKQAPIMIFSKSYCPHSKFVKDLLQIKYQISPAPFVVELDLHPHGRELQDYIGEVTGRKTVPNVHVNGVSRGGGDEFRALEAENTIETKLKEWGNVSVKKIA